MRAAIGILAALAATLGSAQAQAPRVGKVLEKSYELWLSDVVSFPTRDNGSITVRPCEECAPATHRVTAGTTYLLGGSRPVLLPDFLRAVDDRRSRRNTYVSVYLDAETQQVNRIVLRYGDR